MKVRWRNVALQEVAEIERDIIEPSAIPDGTTYVGLENIETGGLFVNVRSVANGELASTKFVFTDRHVLYGKLRPYLAKIARPTFNGVCSTDILPILPSAELDRNYLIHFLRQPSMVDLATSRSTGANLPRLSPKVLAEFSIPLPPIAEQKRIAAILDKAEELRGLRRQALGELDAIVQSIFLEMFGDPASNLKRWAVKSMGECVQKIQIGPFGTQLHEEDYIDNGIPSINPMHIQGGKIVPNSSFSVSVEKYKQLSQYHLEIHDVILGRRGEMGRCAVVTEVENGWLCGTGSLFVRPIHSLINSIYLFTLLSSKSIKKYLERASQGVTMANLNKTIVSQIPVTVPPLSLQQEFAQRVEAIEQLKATHRESLAQLDALFASLQHRAFRGEL